MGKGCIASNTGDYRHAEKEGQTDPFWVRLCRDDTTQIATASAESGKYAKSRRRPRGGGQKPVLQETEAPKQETGVFLGSGENFVASRDVR